MNNTTYDTNEIANLPEGATVKIHQGSEEWPIATVTRTNGVREEWILEPDPQRPGHLRLGMLLRVEVPSRWGPLYWLARFVIRPVIAICTLLDPILRFARYLKSDLQRYQRELASHKKPSDD